MARARGHWHGRGLVIGSGPGWHWIDYGWNAVKCPVEQLRFARQEEELADREVTRALQSTEAAMRQAGRSAKGRRYLDFTDQEKTTITFTFL